MTNRRFALACTAGWLALICATLGPPRLIGIGCTSAANPWGISLARHESDFIGPCDQIERINRFWSK